jgi:hypothetical protein
MFLATVALSATGTALDKTSLTLDDVASCKALTYQNLVYGGHKALSYRKPVMPIAMSLDEFLKSPPFARP